MGCVGKTLACVVKTITFLASAIVAGGCGYMIYTIVHAEQYQLLYVPCATLAVTALVCIAICCENDCLYRTALAALILCFLLNVSGLVVLYLLTHTKLADEVDPETKKVLRKMQEDEFDKKGYIGIGIQLGIQIVYIALPVILGREMTSSPVRPIEGVLHREIAKTKSTLRDARHRRQRAKHWIVPPNELVNPVDLAGQYMQMTQEDFDAQVCDNESALAFAAKVGLIQNVRKCPKCHRDMALCKFNNSCGYRWVCRRTEEGRRFTCSVRGMRKDTILDDRLVGILTMLRIMFMYSQNTPAETIITSLDIGHVRSARTILTRLKDMIDSEIKQIQPNMTDHDIEETRKLFLESKLLDRFGHMLHWGARYKNDRLSCDAKTSSEEEHEKDEHLERNDEIKEEMEFDLVDDNANNFVANLAANISPAYSIEI
uniref:Zn(2)-C6 fungal-type domain-containing protein n=2 Tax=Panagrolaimus sp. JU765 TaxID=591449 RepID=A0AC34RQM5_9BILA